MAPSFSDIDGHWAKACILALADRKLVSGYPDGTFRPDAVITRAEFTALTYRVFPNAASVRSPIDFPDVQTTDWFYQTVRWAYERGFFSGYDNGSFQPGDNLSRLQALLVLVNTAHLTAPALPEDLLKLYFTDATEVPDWAKGAIAAAVSGNLVVNYPEIRMLRPTQQATRGEVCAFLCRVLNLENTVPPQQATWYWGLSDITGTLTVPFDTWKGSARLMRDIQTRLAALSLYPATEINGEYNWNTEQGLTKFCDRYGLSAMKVGVLDAPFAQTLLQSDPTDIALEQARNRTQVYNDFLAQEAGFDVNKLAFLDRGIKTSPYASQIAQYPDRLMQKPDGTQTVALGESVTPVGSTAPVLFTPYPSVGTRPTLDTGLEFLHSDIQSACLCVGSMVNGQMRSHWMGRNGFTNYQLWSSTKVLPLMNVVCRANALQPTALMKDCTVRPVGATSGHSVYNLAVDMVTYQTAIATSNAIALTFKLFSTPTELETWVKQITGSPSLEFRGRYGEAAYISRPSLYHAPSSRTVLTAPVTSHPGNNLLSPYDLTRFISMLGWHPHLAPEARLPSAQWNSLETVVRAMGMDSARYLDVAIARLGIASVMESPVILSKLGFGVSDTRGRTELVYLAHLQFVDTRPRRRGKPGIWRTVSMALLAVKDLNDINEESRQLDARMAAEVTEIVRRLMTQELA